MPLDHDSTPMREYHKAKRLHWDPAQLDFEQDQAQWTSLAEREKGALLQLSSLFLIGEEAVTHDLAPLLVCARETGRGLEEEIFLATQLYEEAKHAEFFHRWLNEVPGIGSLPEDHLTPSYQKLFLEWLPEQLSACLRDPSRLKLATASVAYHMIIEGVMAETGYHTFARAIKQRHLFPGLLDGVTRVQQDEARHVAFGLYFIRALVKEEPGIWPSVLATLNEGLVLATGSLDEAFIRWGDDIPFGLSATETVEYASRQFGKRFAALQRD
jgi:ribonucleoside-diphosphate reductase beta chain